MIKGTLEQMEAFGMCGQGLEGYAQHLKENNITEITFEDSIQFDISCGRRDWAIWGYEKKPLMAKALNYVIPAEEAAADAIILQELKTGVPTGIYSFNNQEYDTLDLAKNAKEQFLAEKRLKIEPLITTILVTNQDGHETWDPVDLNDASIPVGDQYSYGVFNPATGQHIFASSVDEAKSKKEETILENVNSQPVPIFSINKHKWFLNNPFPVEVME